MRNFSIITLLATLLFVGCSETFVEQKSPLANETSLPDLTANFADDGLTRTYVEDGKYLRWHEADLITAFFGNTLNRQYKFKGATGANSGTFSLVPSGELGTGNDLDAIYALYPYDENAVISDEGVISLTLPATQSYAESSFGKGANTMVAVTESTEDTFLSFKNACGYLKLNLYNADGATLKSVAVKGNNDEKIAGSATVAMEFGGVPELTMGDDATTTVTLDCGDGIALGTTAETATALWIVLPETTFEGGITITATDSNGVTFEKSTSNAVAITRNDIQPMAALGVEFIAPVAKPANNEIWYTNGSTTEATTPYETNAFGANIVSNTYDAEKECWVIKFDGDVTKIGYHAFVHCTSLTSVTIPDSVTTIENYAFLECTLLTNVNIPNTVMSVGDNSFVNCTSLPIINNVRYADTILVSVTDRTLNTYEIREGTRFIGSSAFSNCENLVNINIPNSVTTIGSNAFYDCSSLTSINIPDSITAIGYYAFIGCHNLTNVYIADLSAWCRCEFMGTFDSYDINLCLNNEVISDLIIPADITEIKGCTFSRFNIKSVVIPDNVTSIGSFAFEGCGNLTDVIIGNNVTTIRVAAFVGCGMLSSVTIGNSVEYIGHDAFGFCMSLESITIPDSVTTFENNPFGYNRIKEFKGKFAEDNGRCLIIDNTIVAYAFASGTEYTIPYGVTAIGNCAFCGESLTSITIPSSVTYIGLDALSNYHLTEVYCKATTPPIANGLFMPYQTESPIIYVPMESVDAYKTAEYWSDYADSIVGYDFTE